MLWPTVMETLAVSAHRQVALMPWPSAADPEDSQSQAADAEPPAAGGSVSGAESGAELDAW
jgi:hypothetical protein